MKKWIEIVLIAIMPWMALSQDNGVKVQFPGEYSLGSVFHMDTENQILYSINYQEKNISKWDLWRSLPLGKIDFTDPYHGEEFNFYDNLTAGNGKLFVYGESTEVRKGFYIDLKSFKLEDGIKVDSLSNLVSKEDLRNSSLSFNQSNNSFISGENLFTDVTGMTVQKKLFHPCGNNLKLYSGNYIVDSPNKRYYEKYTRLNNEIFEFTSIAGVQAKNLKSIALIDMNYSSVHIMDVSCDKIEHVKSIDIPKISNDFRLNFIDDIGTKLVLVSGDSIFLINQELGNYKVVSMKNDTLVPNPFLKNQSSRYYYNDNLPSIVPLNGRCFELDFGWHQDVIDFDSSEIIICSRDAHYISNSYTEVLFCKANQALYIYDINSKSIVRKIDEPKSIIRNKLAYLANSYDIIHPTTSFSVELFPILKKLNYPKRGQCFSWDASSDMQNQLGGINSSHHLKSYYYGNFAVTGGDYDIEYSHLYDSNNDILYSSGNADCNGDGVPHVYGIDKIGCNASGALVYAGPGEGVKRIDFLSSIGDSLLTKVKYYNSGETDKIIDSVVSTFYFDLRPDRNEFVYLSHNDSLILRNYQNKSTVVKWKCTATDPYIKFTLHGDSLLFFDTDSSLSLVDLTAHTVNRVELPLNISGLNISFSHNRHHILIDGFDSDYQLTWLKNGKSVIKSVKLLKGKIDERNKPYYERSDFDLYSISEKGEVYKIKNNQWYVGGKDSLALELAILDGNDYVIYAPDGYYCGSPEAIKSLSFVSNNEVFPYTQFDHIFNRPDIISQRLADIYGINNKDGVEYLNKIYRKRLKKLGLKIEDVDMGNLPEIELINKSSLPKKSEGTIQLQIEATKGAKRLKTLVIEINDVPTEHLSLYQGSAKQEIELNINTASGFNMIRLYAEDIAGNRSTPEYVLVYDNKKIARKKQFVVTIGASRYEQTSFNLEYAQKDANDIKNLFSNKQLNQSFLHLSNEDLKGDIVGKISTFLSDAKVDDEIILFYAGHGVLDENLNYYLATYDMDFNNPSEKGLAYDKLEQVLSQCKALKKLVLIDACHSGEIDKDEVIKGTNLAQNSESLVFRTVNSNIQYSSKAKFGNSTELMKDLFADIRVQSGATVISSAGGAEFAIESDKWSNGLFTYTLINGLKERSADLNKDDNITISELKTYLQKTVLDLSSGMQKPTSRSENVSMDFVIWRN